MEFPLMAYKLIDGNGSFDYKVANDQEELKELMKKEYHFDFKAVIDGNADFSLFDDKDLVKEENKEETEAEVKKRAKKSKELEEEK